MHLHIFKSSVEDNKVRIHFLTSSLVIYVRNLQIDRWSLAEIVKRFVDSMSTNHEACVDIVEQLLEMKEALNAKFENANKNAW